MSEAPSHSPLVVIGASAGGVEALAELVGTLRAPFPAPIVIAQHLDPTRPSHLGEILARRSSLSVVSVEAHAVLLLGTIYVVPANRHVQITDHDMTVLPDGAGRPKPSVDLLLTSAAAVYGEQLIAVILTGTGSDGALGGRAVHEAGGTVVIQNPLTAAYPGMPSALAPETVDIVADLPRIGPLLHDLLAGIAVPPRPELEQDLGPLLDLVQQHSDIDFHVYKPATILRRLQRRITATECSGVASYSAYLQDHPEEYDRLVSSFLIKVTGFMRDPELFAVLREQVLPELIAANRTQGKELRIWSAGCATGEEAYSLAILACEVLGEDLASFAVRIFATDLDADAVAFARQGIYPVAALAGLPDHLTSRYFAPVQGGYAINKQVRSLIVFGAHDLGQRPPFPHIDLVLCRNVLIYFSKELQQRALQLFAFALREGGYLVLGRTETVRPLAEYFAPQFPPHKIYRRQGERQLSLPLPPLARVPQAGGRAEQRPGPAAGRELFVAQQETQLVRAAWDSLLGQLQIGVVVVDARYDIQDINIIARRLLSIHTPAIGEDFVHLAQHVPPRPLRAAIDRTMRSAEISTLDQVEVPHVTTGEPVYLQITCYPHQPGEATPATALIQVVDVTAGVRAGQELAQARSALTAREAALAVATADLESTKARLARQNDEVARLTAIEVKTGQELVQARSTLAEVGTDLESSKTRLAQQNDEVQRLSADLAAARRQADAAVAQHTRQMEHLVATNRDVLAANEELARANTALRALSDRSQLNAEQAQAAIEESETLNEELQAANEEQETLNEQLQAAIEELNTSNDDLAARGDDLGRLTLAKEKLQQRLLHGAIQAQENERRRVARELHDDIGQSLTALALVLGVIQKTLPEPAGRAQRILDDGMVLVENMMGGLRRVIADLRPPVLDDLGLVPALQRLASDLQQRAAVAVVVEADEDSERLPREVELTLFRVAQEALANIGKHANARNATIMLRQDHRQVTLFIEDDGRGLQTGAAAAAGDELQLDRGNFGLLGMRERVMLLNGRFRVEDAPQRGTRIRVELPAGQGVAAARTPRQGLREQ